MTGENCCQFVHPVGGEGLGKIGRKGSIVILAHCDFHFIRGHENLVKDPSNNKHLYLT